MHVLAWHVYGPSQSDRIAMELRRIVQDGDLNRLNKIRFAMSERAFPYESKRKEGWVFFCETVIRTNHSCRPNAQACFDSTKERLRIRATRLIETGEEITLSYINENCKRKERWSRLRIECKCEECCLVGDQFIRSENDRAELGTFYDTIFKLRNKHNMDRIDIFTMTDAAARAIDRDADTKDFLEMQKNLAKRPPPSSVYLALACDTIAIILLAGSEDDKWAYIDSALAFLTDELDILKIIAGLDHECTVTLVEEIRDV